MLVESSFADVLKGSYPLYIGVAGVARCWHSGGEHALIQVVSQSVLCLVGPVRTAGRLNTHPHPLQHTITHAMGAN